MVSLGKKRVAAFLTALAIMICFAGNIFPAGTIKAAAADTMQLEGTVRPEYYAREALKSLPNGTELIKFYDMIVEAAEKNVINAEDNWVHVEAYENGITSLDAETAGAVYLAYTADHPEAFWLGQRYGYMTLTDGTLYSLLLESDSALYELKGTFEAAVKKTVADAGVTAEMSDYEKALRLHDEIAKIAEYDYEFKMPHAHSAYGALVDKVCVCEGYAESYQYLLQYCGIQSLRIAGQGYKSNGTSEAHAWTALRLDGKYYYSDLTWDDQGTEEYDIYHYYTNVTLAFISADHEAQATQLYANPAADSEEMNYFTVNGGIMPADSLDIDFISDSISRYGYAAVRLTGSDYASTLANSYADNIGQILNDIGATTGSRGYSYSAMGREYHLFASTQCGDLKNASHTFGAPETVKAATATEAGTSKTVCSVCGYIRLSDIPCKEPETEPDVKLGDITGDGDISADDLTALARHVAKIELITDSSILEAADVNCDGDVDAQDLTTLARFVAKIIDRLGAE